MRFGSWTRRGIEESRVTPHIYASERSSRLLLRHLAKRRFSIGMGSREMISGEDLRRIENEHSAAASRNRLAPRSPSPSSSGRGKRGLEMRVGAAAGRFGAPSTLGPLTQPTAEAVQIMSGDGFGASERGCLNNLQIP